MTEWPVRKHIIISRLNQNWEMHRVLEPWRREWSGILMYSETVIMMGKVCNWYSLSGANSGQSKTHAVSTFQCYQTVCNLMLSLLFFHFFNNSSLVQSLGEANIKLSETMQFDFMLSFINLWGETQIVAVWAIQCMHIIYSKSCSKFSVHVLQMEEWESRQYLM